MEDPKSGAVRLSEEGESMYIVITAAADINVAYSGNDRNEALKTIIIEAWKYILDTREELPADIPAPGDISRLEDGWSFTDKNGQLNATMNVAGAEISYGEDRVLIRLKEIQLDRQQLKEAAETYDALVREEVVRDRIRLRGLDYAMTQEQIKEAVAVYSDVLDEYGTDEEDALEALEKFLSRVEDGVQLPNLEKDEQHDASQVYFRICRHVGENN